MSKSNAYWDFPLIVHFRVDVVQRDYTNNPKHFENHILPIAAYDRDGIIAGANKLFRNLIGVSENDIQKGAINLYDYIDEKKVNLIDLAHNAFNGGERVCKDARCILQTEAEQTYLYPFAILFPMTRDGDDVTLAGIMLGKDEFD